MFDKGFFGDLFDMNGDGKLDDVEEAVDFAVFMNIIEDEEKDTADENDFFDDFETVDDEDDDEFEDLDDDD